MSFNHCYPQRQYCWQRSIMSLNSPCPHSVVTSLESAVNWRALVSNKVAKPGWYRAYCRSRIWNWPVWTPLTANLSVLSYVCLHLAQKARHLEKVSYEIKKAQKHLQSWQDSEDKHSSCMQTAAYKTYTSATSPIKLHYLSTLRQHIHLRSILLGWWMHQEGDKDVEGAAKCKVQLSENL